MAGGVQRGIGKKKKTMIGHLLLIKPFLTFLLYRGADETTENQYYSFFVTKKTFFVRWDENVRRRMIPQSLFFLLLLVNCRAESKVKHSETLT